MCSSAHPWVIPSRAPIPDRGAPLQRVPALSAPSVRDLLYLEAWVVLFRRPRFMRRAQGFARHLEKALADPPFAPA